MRPSPSPSPFSSAAIRSTAAPTRPPLLLALLQFLLCLLCGAAPAPAAAAFKSPPLTPTPLTRIRGGGGGCDSGMEEGMGGNGSKKVVCVTGCNGYVAAELVKQLLQRGYHVRGTVRSLSYPQARARYAFLEGMAAGLKGGGKLELVEADLQSPGSFDAAVAGCACVFHVASPVVYDTPDPQRDLVAPALAGVENVLGAVQKAMTMDAGAGAGKGKKTKGPRVVLTSSTGAIYGGPGATPKDAALGLFTAEDWNTVASLETLPYYYSKVVAERRAWELAEAGGIDLVVVNPAYVWGPPAARGAGSFNTARLRAVLRGEQPPWAFAFPVCDTRDIAAVQIAAAEAEAPPPTAGAASGHQRRRRRYIISSPESVSPQWIAEVIARRFPGRFPRMGQVDPSITGARLFDVRQTEALLGRPLRPPEETLCDMIQALLEEEEK